MNLFQAIERFGSFDKLGESSIRAISRCHIDNIFKIGDCFYTVTKGAKSLYCIRKIGSRWLVERFQDDGGWEVTKRTPPLGINIFIKSLPDGENSLELPCENLNVKQANTLETIESFAENIKKFITNYQEENKDIRIIYKPFLADDGRLTITVLAEKRII